MDIRKDRRVTKLAYSLNLLDLDEILNVAIKEIPPIIGAYRIAIYLLDKEEKNFILKRHTSKILQDYKEKIPIDSKNSIIPQVLIKNKPILITDIKEFIEKNNLDIQLSKRQKYTSGSSILVPLKVYLPNDSEKILGALHIAEKIDFTPFTKHDLHLATYIGEILGTSIHNYYVIEKKLGGHQKELMEELDKIKEAYVQKDLKLAEAKKKQNQMLPEIPKIENYEIDVKYMPMETIGGDFYDFIQIKENEIGIVIGDVSGHGIEAALVMSMAKQVLSIYSKLYNSLIEILFKANEEICESLKGESFVAVFLGILNTDTHILRYARAGQTYPLIYNPNKHEKPEELKSKGIVLGTVKGDLFKAKIEEKYIQFSPGDILLLYTDGAIESNNSKGEEFSLERLCKVFQDNSDKSAKEITKNISQELENFTNGEKFDDITILCLKVGNIDTKNISNGIDKIIEKNIIEDAESFIISPELSYEENMQFQILELEKKIEELENQVVNLKKEKKNLEKKCKELDEMLELKGKDPDLLIKMLKNQLKVALELPKDLINENKRLHLEIEKQRQELRKLELELQDWIKEAESLKKDNKNNKNNEEVEKILLKINKIIIEKLQNIRYINDKVIDYLKEKNYEKAIKELEKLFNIALKQVNVTYINYLKEQIFTILKIFTEYLIKK